MTIDLSSINARLIRWWQLVHVVVQSTKNQSFHPSILLVYSKNKFVLFVDADGILKAVYQAMAPGYLTLATSFCNHRGNRQVATWILKFNSVA